MNFLTDFKRINIKNESLMGVLVSREDFEVGSRGILLLRLLVLFRLKHLLYLFLLLFSLILLLRL